MKLSRRVLLGMSGGTDSSVAAMLLKDAGYKVTGVTFSFYELNGSTEYLEDARILARELQIDHIIYDAREVFKTRIIDYFIKEYMSGHTPVPCTLCNNYLKWPLLKELADSMGIHYLSTGHYVQVQQMNGKYYIVQGEDTDKDQSFFLWGLEQDILSRMILPLGEYTKTEVRAIAAQRGFIKVATKKDSIGVCFCPMDYRSFLIKEVGKEYFTSGNFVNESGTVVGRHEGFPFYTIGQRRGLGIYLNRAVFVKEIMPESNVIILGDLNSLEKREMWLEDWNIVEESELFDRNDIIVKIRYRKQKNHCTVTITEDNLLHVCLHEPLTSIAVGQAAAFYSEDRVLGGGIICRSSR